MLYEEAVAQMPSGWVLWGHFGDGQWRAGPSHQETRVIASSIKEAVDKSRREAGLELSPS